MEQIPLFESNPNERAIFTPRDFHVYKGTQQKLPKNAIIVYSRKLFAAGLGLPSKRLAGIDLTKQSYTQGDCGVYFSMIGGPAATALLEEVVDRGVEKVINLGIAGALRPETPIGGFMVPDRAIRDEGTSFHYQTSGRYSYPNQDLTENLIQALTEAGESFTTGTTWTTDAPYRETPSKVRNYRDKENTISVEMETASLFAAGQYLGIPVASLFLVSDHVQEKWTPNFDHQDLDSQKTKALALAMEALLF